MSQENNNKKYIDDGRTIYNMDLDGMPWRRRSQKKAETSLSRKERRALIKAAFTHYAPIFIIVIICFALTILLIKIWLG